MSDTTQTSPQPRSPNAPKIPLEQALVSADALYKKAGRSLLNREAAATALGYKGLTGSSLTLLAALNQYGLIDPEKGGVKISPLALRIFHPTSDKDKADAIREAALLPAIYAEIFENHKDLAEDVLANQLVHRKFAPDIAKKIASAYKANEVFAKLSDIVKPVSVSPEAKQPVSTAAGNGDPFGFFTSPKAPMPPIPPVKIEGELATFNVPVGQCEARLTFTGAKLELDDFDAVAEYMGMFKKQYARKLAAQAADAKTAAIASTPTGEKKDASQLI